MSELCKKYKITEDQFRAMVRDGYISTTVLRHDQIYESFKNEYSISANVREAIVNTSVRERVDESTVYRVIRRFGK